MDLTDAQWERVAPLIPNPPRRKDECPDSKGLSEIRAVNLDDYQDGNLRVARSIQGRAPARSARGKPRRRQGRAERVLA